MRISRYRFVWFLLLWLTSALTFFLYLYFSQLKEELEELKVTVERFEAELNRLMIENIRLDNKTKECNKMNNILMKENQMFKSDLTELSEHMKNVKTKERECEIKLKQCSESKNVPSTEYELTRRQIFKNVNSFWYFIKSRISRLRSKVSLETSLVMNGILIEGEDRWGVIISDLSLLTEYDGFNKWRVKEENELSSEIQERLQALQNPADCSTAGKLVCKLNKHCGYGCQIHHVVYCFISAYAMHRMLVLDSTNWRYSSRGWENVFKPLSDTCVSNLTYIDSKSQNVTKAPGVLYLPVVDKLRLTPAYLPPAVPEDLALRLQRMHGAPGVWWVGQFLKYILRPQPTLQAEIERMTTIQ